MPGTEPDSGVAPGSPSLVASAPLAKQHCPAPQQTVPEGQQKFGLPAQQTGCELEMQQPLML